MTEGQIYLAPSGQWSWRVVVDGEEVAHGGGYESELQAEADMEAELAEQESRAGIDWE